MSFQPRSFQLLMVGLFAAAAVACNAALADKTPVSRILRGEAVALGKGTVQAYLEMSNGTPVEIGVELSEAVMEGLPAPAKEHAGHDMHEVVVAPPVGNTTPFSNIVLNWNPAGHEPEGVYNVAHFDFHFYTIDEAG